MADDEYPQHTREIASRDIGKQVQTKRKFGLDRVYGDAGEELVTGTLEEVGGPGGGFYKIVSPDGTVLLLPSSGDANRYKLVVFEEDPGYGSQSSDPGVVEDDTGGRRRRTRRRRKTRKSTSHRTSKRLRRRTARASANSRGRSARKL
jgi:hypothetical protein